MKYKIQFKLLGFIICVIGFVNFEKSNFIQMIKYYESKEFIVGTVSDTEEKVIRNAPDQYFVKFSVRKEGKNYEFNKRIYLNIFERIKFNTNINLLYPGASIKLSVLFYNEKIDCFPTNYITNYFINLILYFIFVLFCIQLLIDILLRKNGLTTAST